MNVLKKHSGGSSVSVNILSMLINLQQPAWTGAGLQGLKNERSWLGKIYSKFDKSGERPDESFLLFFSERSS